MSAFVELKDVKKTYQMGEIVIHAVDGINFEIQKGEFVVIVGPSGAGKTTVLNILGGMDTCTSGSIVVDGTDISTYTNRQLTTYRRDDIGFVFQFYNLVQNLTALENVELALQISKNPLDAEMVMKEVGLEDRMSNFPAQLSGGEQQMLAIGRALMSHPKLLLLDEPSLGLSPLVLMNIMETLKRIKERGTAILLVEQNAAESLRIADYAYVLETGRVVISGRGPDLMTDEKAK